MHFRFRTAIPDEIDGQPIAFANAYERDERPGELTAMLIADGKRTILGVGDRFELGPARLRLAAIEPRDGAHVIVVERLEDLASSSEPGMVSVALVPISIRDLAAVLQTLTPAILTALGGDGGVIPEWFEDTRSTMHREWNGEEVGPVTTRQLKARLAGTADAAEVTVTEICRAADRIEAQELSAYWAAARRRVHVFARGEGTQSVAELRGTPDADDIMALIAKVVAAH